MNKPFPAYKGAEPFVFVCYAHSDSEDVYADLVQLNEEGINLWYDEGIPAGSSWRAEIAVAIQGASKLLFFISASSLKSNHCLREVDYALNHDIEIIPVYLDESTLPPELELALNRVQALFRKNDSRYMEHLQEVLQGNAGMALLRPFAKKRNLNIMLPLVAMGFVFFLGVMWLQTNSSQDSRQISSGSTALPNAFDRYIEGVELLERWAYEDNLETAINLLQESIDLDPQFALGYARLAEGLRIKYAVSGDSTWLEEAIEYSDQALNLNQGLAPVQVVAGRLQSTQGNYDLAFASLERALSIDPNDALANQAIASLYNRLGRLEDAESAYKKAVTLEPDNLFILDTYGNYLERQGRYEEAIVQWQTVIRLEPEYYSVMVNLGSALIGSGRFAEAIIMLERANEIRPSYMANSNLGMAYSSMNRYPEAIDVLQKAIEFDSENWLAWGNLAYTYSWMGGADAEANEAFEQAIELAESVREQSPRDPFVHADLALYYAKTDQRELATQRLETALLLAPDLSEITASAAEIYEIFDERERALEMIAKSIDLGYPQQLFFRNPELSDLLNDVEI